MALLRKTTLDQMKRVNAEISKQGGDIGDKTKNLGRYDENKMPNAVYFRNPLSGGHVDCYEDFASTDIDKSNKKVKKIHEMFDFIKENKIENFGDIVPEINNSPQDINAKIKNLRNWIEGNVKSTKPVRERDIITSGKFIEVDDKIKGYINRIEGDKVYIELIDGSMSIVEIPMSKIKK